MSQGRARNSWMRAVGDKRLLWLEECGVRELLITPCQMMILMRDWCLLVWERKRKAKRSWCCKVLWRNLAEDWMRCNPGKAVRWRRRRKTPPRRVFRAAARVLAPKINIRLKQAGELKAEHRARDEGNRTQDKPIRGTQTRKKKGGVSSRQHPNGPTPRSDVAPDKG